MSIWHKVAALSGFSAVAAASFGAHGFSPINPYYNTVFETANKLHFYHTFLIALAPITRRPAVVGSLATAGVVLFSGSCYATALTEDSSNSKPAPIGGMTLMAAWLALAL